MKKVLVKSVYDAFDYVMDHYYPSGLREMVKRSDTYAVISLQDSHNGGFGLCFDRNEFCRDVLTIRVDDVWRAVDDRILFNESMAEDIIAFIDRNRDVDTLLVHCYAGKSRSLAVGAFAVKFLGKDNSAFFNGRSPNMHIYNTLVKVYNK